MDTHCTPWAPISFYGPHGPAAAQVSGGCCCCARVWAGVHRGLGSEGGGGSYTPKNSKMISSVHRLLNSWCFLNHCC